MRRSPVGAVKAIVLLAAAAALFAARPTPALTATIRVEIKNIAYNPARFEAHAGDTVEWVNRDFVDHTATARSGEWDVTIPAGATRRTELAHAGEVEFYCRLHPNMTGVATVR